MRAWRAAKRYALALCDGHPDFGAYRRLLRHERLGAAALEDLRLRKARRLLRACQEVPYYAPLLRAAGLAPESLRSLDQLSALPLLDKPVLRAAGAGLLHSRARPETYFEHASGGSTGMPVTFFRGIEYDALANTAANLRAMRRAGWRPGDRVARFWPPDPLPAPRGALGRLRRRARFWLGDSEMLIDAFDMSPAALEESRRRLRDFHPRTLYGYAGNLVLLARLLAERGETIPSVAGIVSTAEALFPDQRALLRQVFPGATVIDVYGSREIPGIAAECGHGTMHVNSDLVHVEYLPVPADPGRQRLVVTALDNLVFPFIRYDIDDYGSPLAGACRCSLPFPAMRWGVGKIKDAFVTPEGRLVSGAFFSRLMLGARGVHAFQFRQRAPGRIILYVVKGEGFDDQVRARLEALRDDIRAGFSAQASLAVELVDAIPLTPAGKHRFIVSEVPRPAEAPPAPLPDARPG